MYTLFHNGYIHTLDNNSHDSNALLVLDDRIIFHGDHHHINVSESQVRRVDLQGLHIYPGFIDCHTHVAWAAIDMERIRLDDCQSLSDALKKIRKHVNKEEKGDWVLGGGWNANLWKDGMPHKSQLDKITSDHPIALFNKDAHTQWLNSRAMQIVHFENDTSDPPGGKLGRDTSGELTGLVYEKACDIVYRASENITFEQLERCLNNYSQNLFALGITSVHSCESLKIWSLFQEMNQKNKLPLRICMHPPVEEAGTFTKVGLCSGWGNEYLRLGGLKYFVDGSLGSQTAEMFTHYDGLGHAGIEVITEEALSAQLRQAAEKGFSATIHAIGDKANFKTLNVLESIQDISAQRNLRHRIEHAQIIQKSDIKRFSNLNVIASMQPLHITDDVKIAEKYLGKRAENAYPVGSLLRSGCRVVFGSDVPITDPDPLKGIQSAMTRRFQLDRKEPSWFPDECISASDALYAYTKQAAYASYEEHLKGTLLPGKLADFVALPIEIEKANEDQLRGTKVKMTVLGGKVVYQNFDA